MKNEKLEAFNVVGISVRTTNENQQMATDIGALWQKFMSEGILAQIPHKIDDTVYCIYADYEKDFTKPYTTFLGCRVSSLEGISPNNWSVKTIKAGEYAKFSAKGSLLEGVVFGAWEKIWQMDLPRAYTTDFEVYGEKAQNPTDAEVDIFIAIK